MAKGGRGWYINRIRGVTSRIHLLLIFETKIADKHDFLSFILRFLWRQRETTMERERGREGGVSELTVRLLRFRWRFCFLSLPLPLALVRYFVFLNVILSDVAKVKT